MAPPSYWSRVQVTLDRLSEANWQVQYEKVTGQLPAELTTVPFPERTLWDVVQALFPGAAPQSELVYRPEWVNSDVSLQQFWDADGGYTLRRMMKPMTLEVPPVAPMWAKRLAILFLAGTSVMPSMTAKVLRTQRVVISMRDAIAAEAIATSAYRDVAALWGACHVPGITAGLRHRGWIVESVIWTRALPWPGTSRSHDIDGVTNVVEHHII